MKTFIYKWLLKRLIARSCESRIPRSGSRGEAVNCYVVAIDREDSPYFVATAINENGLEGLQWNGRAYADALSLSMAEVVASKLNITHYYGLAEVTYDSIYDAAWHYLSKIAYVKISLHRELDSTSQYFFNKRKLVTKKRIDLLRTMMDDQLDREQDGIEFFDLMEKIYTLRLFLHPSMEQQNKKVQLYLDSLIASEDLVRVNTEYVVTPRAIGTIERYEEEERRHTEAVKLQRLMFGITILGVVFTAVQAGFIKLPTVIDLSKLF